MGSGTTASVARKLNRNSVGYEVNAEFISMIKEKIGTSDAFNEVKIEIIKQPESKIDFEEKISELPYQFIDTHKLDKKIDVKKLQFGSKIDAEGSEKREEYFTVKEIISPELLKLSNNLVIRLIGIKQNPAINGKATEFLREKLRGKKVFLRYDEVKHDSNNHLMVYLYLENRTFINAHLLKEGLVEVDESLEFRYKSKFEKI
jgi:site-specific DNA-methyltransferase (adenine-specific)